MYAVIARHAVRCHTFLSLIVKHARANHLLFERFQIDGRLTLSWQFELAGRA